MVNGILIEICIGNITDALAVSKYPVDRIELNSAIELGGLSPSVETLRYLKERIPQKIVCMLRPRGGDFLYDDAEYEVMKKDAENFLQNGADGIVFGFLREDHTVFEARAKEMASLAHRYGKEAVFHKAFDETPDLKGSAKILTDCGIDRILTGGKAPYPDIVKGAQDIQELNREFGERVTFLPGGGVRVGNVNDVLDISGSKQIHMTSKKEDPGGYLKLDEEQLQAFLQKIGSR